MLNCAECAKGKDQLVKEVVCESLAAGRLVTGKNTFASSNPRRITHITLPLFLLRLGRFAFSPPLTQKGPSTAMPIIFSHLR